MNIDDFVDKLVDNQEAVPSNLPDNSENILVTHMNKIKAHLD